jgi:hypothetical protein
MVPHRMFKRSSVLRLLRRELDRIDLDWREFRSVS